jgi:hypothetical protein
MNELRNYRDRRQQTNADKALAYLKWRSNLLRKVLVSNNGWQVYTKRLNLEKQRHNFKIGKIEQLTAQNKLSHVFA